MMRFYPVLWNFVIRLCYGIFRHSASVLVLSHRISTAYARFICRELNLSQAQQNQFLSGTSCDSETLFSQRSISSGDFISFLSRVKSAYPDPELSLKTSTKMAVTSFGELGTAILSAPDLRHALMMGSEFVRLHASYFGISLSYKKSEAIIECHELTDLEGTQQFQTEVLMIAMQNFIEAITGTIFSDGAYIFPFPPPSNLQSYSDYYHSPCHFNGQTATIVIPEKYMDMKSIYHDPVVWRDYQDRFEQRIRNVSGSKSAFSEAVEEFLTTSALPVPSASDTACRFNITERTLSRRLKQENISFREIRESTLKKQAIFYLEETDLSIDAIACQLGYKDFSSFRRAFRKWKQMSPGDYRAKNK